MLNGEKKCLATKNYLGKIWN